MKKIMSYFVAAICVGWGAVSCVDPIVIDDSARNQEETKPDSAVDSVSFTVTLEQGETKTLLSENEVLWSQGDEIRVFNAQNNMGKVFTLNDESVGMTTGTFSGPVLDGDGPFYAVYPASAATSLTSTAGGPAISLTVSDTQVYETEWDTFGVGANLSAGTTSVLSEGFAFKNLFGVLRLKVANAASVSSIVLYSKGESDVLNGSFSLSFEEGVPVVTPVENQSAEACQKLTLACGAGYESNREFFLVVPTGMLDAGMTIELYDSQGKAQVKNAGAYSGPDHFINRSHLRPMPEFAYTPQYQAPFLLSQVDAGAFTGILYNSGGCVQTCAHNENSGQYVYKTETGNTGTRYVRIQNWDAGFALGLTTPYGLNAGETVAVTVQPLGSSGVGAVTNASMKVLKRVHNRVWFADAVAGNGYIMMLLEE